MLSRALGAVRSGDFHSAQCIVHSAQFRSRDIARAFLCLVEMASSRFALLAMTNRAFPCMVGIAALRSSQ
ncbi:MAG: hypothetical protein LBL66_04120 [Clostridiales bacterium]|nr:hypothetical protein [Clostridiales bacterium]